ncbi:unnamed protein product [Phytophthora fragariaefolia]|uniref:Unnamed protein product n=1 Tax=Phytophthora fragariaefolia TaxID=1490495 RepID=A0A9W6X0C0_9STRA|nr:unnamed protein product [Phytophthora fragariaefolia]
MNDAYGKNGDSIDGDCSGDNGYSGDTGDTGDSGGSVIKVKVTHVTLRIALTMGRSKRPATSTSFYKRTKKMMKKLKMAA